jgi:hypothetical protein
MLMVEPIPVSWWPQNLYKHRVHVGYDRVGTAWDWCAGTFGPMGDTGWIDQGAYICFVHEHKAAIFDMVWS